MRRIQNSNIAFHCPDALKEKLEAYAEEMDVRVSSLIRAVCVDMLREQPPIYSHRCAHAPKIIRAETHNPF